MDVPAAWEELHSKPVIELCIKLNVLFGSKLFLQFMKNILKWQLH